MTKILSISDVKARLPELVTGLVEREQEIVVTRNGKPAAVLVSYAEYERLKDTLDVLGDETLMKQIRDSARYFARGGKGVAFDQLFGGPAQPARKRARK